jgi:hypothetical protein
MSDSVSLQLRKAANNFDENSLSIKLTLLKDCSLVRPKGLKEIRLYHDSLLFLLSYAENEEQYTVADKEMRRLTEIVENLPVKKKQSLERSGIAHTETQGAYSFTLIKWLIKEYPDNIQFHSLGEEGIHPKDLLKQVLPEMEFELCSDDSLKPEAWLKKAAGTKNKSALLRWLIFHFEQLDCSEALREQWFESLKLFVTIYNPPVEFSRSFGRIEITKRYYHSAGILKRFDEKELIKKTLPKEKKLNHEEKEQLIKTSRIALFLLNRETDPITYCKEDGLKFYELEHGLSIALFSMLPERRLPLESYIGFMMFKNGYPMSYGGAWVFGKRSLIGINIFEAFRGGESAFVFAQLMRTYYHVCGAEYFEVEPYQFGKNNPEGIKSGAFWFYYRFGYRPLDDRLNKLAAEEAAKIANTKGYRTSSSTLKAFTKSNVAVNFSGTGTPLNPSEISKYISAQITKRFNGNRAEAEKWASQKIKREFGSIEKKVFKKLGLFVAFCMDSKKLSSSEKKRLLNWMENKDRNEFDYIDMTKKIDFDKLSRLD